MELRSFQGSCSSLVPGVPLQAESTFAKLKLDMDPFELDSLAALCSCSQSPLSAFSQLLIAERKSNDFCNAFSTGLLPHKIQVHTVSLSCACCVLWYIQCPHGWCPDLQRHCKWFAQFYWEQSCCGWWLWVLFLKVTQAFPSLGISAWVPP